MAVIYDDRIDKDASYKTSKFLRYIFGGLEPYRNIIIEEEKKELAEKYVLLYDTLTIKDIVIKDNRLFSIPSWLPRFRKSCEILNGLDETCHSCGHTKHLNDNIYFIIDREFDYISNIIIKFKNPIIEKYLPLIYDDMHYNFPIDPNWIKDDCIIFPCMIFSMNYRYHGFRLLDENNNIDWIQIEGIFLTCEIKEYLQKNYYHKLHDIFTDYYMLKYNHKRYY